MITGTVKAHFTTTGGKHNLMEAACPYCGHVSQAEDGHIKPLETDTCTHLLKVKGKNTFIFAKKPRS